MVVQGTYCLTNFVMWYLNVNVEKPEERKQKSTSTQEEVRSKTVKRHDSSTPSTSRSDDSTDATVIMFLFSPRTSYYVEISKLSICCSK